jgi:lipopolysaccharide transport system ATP-binding protein
MSSAITVQGLGKKYILNHQRHERYTALRDVLSNGAKNWAGRLLGRTTEKNDPTHEEFWALKDLNLDIKQGDRIGIIGRNGAGKSTLLKILSRITEPTVGKFSINGRVASLLEVGTGFHPELTGRENIFLNGAILGMSKFEIQSKFDEIVAFAEVEKFLDTPVKHYSSGMYVRLAFAVAAHLEPEILIVDEVLAVGDAQFQKKCLGKMSEVSEQGRTVLFVSHNMAMISNLCQKGIVLDAGSAIFQGNISEAILNYYQNAGGRSLTARGHESENASLLSSELVGVSDSLDLTIHDDLTVHMKYRIKRSIGGKCVPNFHFFAPDGSIAFVSNATNVAVLPPGDYVANCHIPGNLLNEGAYFIGLALTTYYDTGSFEVEFFNRNALTFNVIDPMDSRSNRYGYGGPIPGLLRPQLAWNIEKVSQ